MPNSATLCPPARCALFLLLCVLPTIARAQSYELLAWSHADSALCTGATADFRWGGPLLQLNVQTGGLSEIERRLPSLTEEAYQLDIVVDFNPSSSNYLELQWESDAGESYLVLRVGKTEDRLELWRISPSDEQRLATSPLGLLDRSSSVLSVALMHQADQRYALSWGLDGAWETVTSEPDSLLLPAAKLLLRCVYSASRIDKMALGPITVTGRPAGLGAKPRARDWHFTELLASPLSLQPGLSPEHPFVEAVWAGRDPLLLDGWRLRIGSRNYPVPTCWVPAGGTVVFGDSALAALLPPGVLHVPLLLTVPQASQLVLEGPRSERWGHLDYDLGAIEPTEKASGGYSLEASNLPQSCLLSEWAWSTDARGASPGLPPDSTPRSVAFPAPRVRFWGAETFNPQLRIDFQTPMDPSSSLPEGIWMWNSVRELHGSPESWPQVGGTDSLRLPPNFCRCDGQAYPWEALPFGWPVPPQPGDLQLTEWLPDPLPYEPRFVELYNASTRALDLGALFLADPEGGGYWRRLAAPGTFLLPGSIHAYSEDPDRSLQRYPRGARALTWASEEDLPPLEEAQGLGLFLANGSPLDQVDPTYFQGLKGEEGISWRLSQPQRWVLSGDSASPGVHHWLQAGGDPAGLRVHLDQAMYGGLLRPIVSFHWHQDGAWTLQERWTEARLGVGGDWSPEVRVESQSVWECGLPPAPADGVWLWDLRFTSPKGRVYRRSFEVRQVP
jgi:hypothetical protein